MKKWIAWFRWPLLAALALASMSAGCQYEAATQACYDIAETYAARLVTCRYFETQEEAEAFVHGNLAMSGLNCDTSPTGIVDATVLYEECIPALMVLECSDPVPPTTCDQIVYRSG